MARDQRLVAWLEGELDADVREELLRELSSDETSFAGIAADADRTVAAWVKLAPDFGKTHGQAIVGWGDFSILDPSRRLGAAWELGIGDATKPVDISGRVKVAVGGPLTVGHEDLRDGNTSRARLMTSLLSTGHSAGTNFAV